MSLTYKADIYEGSIQVADRNPDYRFILALFCMALAITVASIIFTPAPVGSGVVTSEITSVGP